MAGRVAGGFFSSRGAATIFGLPQQVAAALHNCK